MANKNDQQNLSTRLLLTGMSAMCAESVTFPVDLTKTRLQLQGEGERLSSSQKKGAIGMALSIVRQQGVSGLFYGISPALLRHVFYTPTRIVCYEQFRNYAADNYNNGDRRNLPLSLRLLCGATSGALGQLIASPADLIKVRMQADGKNIAKGLPPRYHSLSDAFIKIIKSEGAAGLWRGWIPNVQRAALVNLGELSTYDAGKQFLLRSGYFQDNIVCHFASSVLSGFVSSVVSCPADVVKTRMMNQYAAAQPSPSPSLSSASLSTAPPSPPTLQYRGSLDCLMQAVKKEGLFSLYKGFFPTWARLAPWQLTFWMSYEQLRRISGVHSF